MLAPKKVKWRKMQKGRRKGMAWRGATLAFGDYGLQAIERGWLTAREIEAARVALTRYIARGGRGAGLGLGRAAGAARTLDRRARSARALDGPPGAGEAERESARAGRR